MLKTVLFVGALLASVSFAQAQESGWPLLGLWAKNSSYCQLLLKEGDPKKLNSSFDEKYIYFDGVRIYMDAYTDYFLHSNKEYNYLSGFIEITNNINEDIVPYHYFISRVRGDTFLTLKDSFGRENVFVRC